MAASCAMTGPPKQGSHDSIAPGWTSCRPVNDLSSRERKMLNLLAEKSHAGLAVMSRRCGGENARAAGHTAVPWPAEEMMGTRMVQGRFARQGRQGIDEVRQQRNGCIAMRLRKPLKPCLHVMRYSEVRGWHQTVPAKSPQYYFKHCHVLQFHAGIFDPAGASS